MNGQTTRELVAPSGGGGRHKNTQQGTDHVGRALKLNTYL